MLLLALQSSLQHEVLHGHPTRNRRFNELLVFLPIGIYLPYLRFRDTHLAHHRDERLTDPYDDPETAYLCQRHWRAMPSALRDLYNFNNCLFGRMLFGPLISSALFYRADLQQVLKGDWRIGKAYLLHLLGLLPVLWLLFNSSLAIAGYLLAAYAALSLLKIRTFLEHRAHQSVAGRTAIVAVRGLLSWLFLNNNFHLVHHQYPALPWYQLPAMFRQHQQRFLTANQQYYYPSYRQVFSHYFWQAKEPVPHPIVEPVKGTEKLAGQC